MVSVVFFLLCLKINLLRGGIWFGLQPCIPLLNFKFYFQTTDILPAKHCKANPFNASLMKKFAVDVRLIAECLSFFIGCQSQEGRSYPARVCQRAEARAVRENMDTWRLCAADECKQQLLLKTMMDHE